MKSMRVILAILVYFSQGTYGNTEFVRCAAFVKRSPPVDATDETKLRVYSFFKQATEGDCPRSRVYTLIGVRKVKLEAWCSLHGMSSIQAQAEYVKMIDNMVPNWRNM